MGNAVNRVPQGLLSLLDMKAAGANPHELSNTLTGVLDITDLYLAPVRQIVSQSIVTAGVGILPSALGPAAGELWFVRQASVVTNAAIAAGTIAFAVGFQPGGNAGFFTGLGVDSRVGVVGERVVSVGTEIAVLQPGDLLSAWISTWTVGPGNIRLTANIAKLLY